eukprot:5176564-Prymnesium_polylepis.2
MHGGTVIGPCIKRPSDCEYRRVLHGDHGGGVTLGRGWGGDMASADEGPLRPGCVDAIFAKLGLPISNSTHLKPKQQKSYFMPRLNAIAKVHTTQCLQTASLFQCQIAFPLPLRPTPS